MQPVLCTFPYAESVKEMTHTPKHDHVKQLKDLQLQLSKPREQTPKLLAERIVDLQILGGTKLKAQ
ncbi:MAG: hypothetical protein ACLPY5_15240 [Candidatus Bathyarchaeia archaeon]